MAKRKTTATGSNVMTLTPEQDFVIQAINANRTEERKGLHTVFTGFNSLFRQKFEGVNPIEVTKQMEAKKLIDIRPSRGGVVLYLIGDAPEKRDKAHELAEKMGL